MLRSFRVANHKSFRDEVELLLMPAYDKSRPVVPVAAVFGANASGKSNLLDALGWLQRAVRGSYAGWEPGAGIPRTPFRLDPEAAARPSLYAVELVLEGQRYTYGIEVDDHRVRGEWLYTYPHNRRRIIFDRERNAVSVGSTVPDHRTRGQQLARQTRDNALLLSVAAHNDLAEVQPVYDWFRSGLGHVGNEPLTDDRLTRRLVGAGSQRVVELIKEADLGIANVTLQQNVTITADLVRRLADEGLVDSNPEQDLKAGGRIDPSTAEQLQRVLPNLIVAGTVPVEHDLRFHHGALGGELVIGEQSAGTKSWINLVLHALDTIEDGGLLVVDEVDASLHPHLTARLTNLFRDPEINHAGAQLVFTTHDATLLDEETLSRDEVWFVEKDPDSGASRLYPLTDFHPRKHEDREGRYLAGSYGAVPVVSDSGIRRALRNGVRDAAA